MNHISNEQHLTQAQLLRYVEDDCSRLEMREIDRHLATCSMCSDAVEGLLLLSNPSIVVDNLNQKIEDKIAEKTSGKTSENPEGKPLKLPVTLLEEQPVLTVVKRPFWQRRWAAAAAVLLLGSSSIWMYKNAQVAENKSVATEMSTPMPNAAEAAPPQYATVEKVEKGNFTLKNTPTNGVANTGGNQALKQAESQKISSDLSKETPIETAVKTVQNAPSTTADVAVIEQKPMVEKPSAAVASAPAVSVPQEDRTRNYPGAAAQNSMPYPAQQKTSAPMKTSDNAVVKTEEYKEKTKDSDDKNLQEVVVTGMSSNKKYAKTAPSEKPTTPSVSDPILSRADAFFNQKKYENAAEAYAQFLAQETEGDLHERAFFQLANCYLKLNKKADAKVIFEKLSATNGQYQRPAKKALKDL